MRTLAAVLFGILLVANLPKHGNANDENEQLEKQLSRADEMMGRVEAVLKYLSQLLVLSLQHLAEGISPLGADTSVSQLLAEELKLIVEFLHVKVQFFSEVARQLSKGILPDLLARIG